jgi:hypothetical protein
MATAAAAAPEQSRAQFVEERAARFVSFLREHRPDEELEAVMAQYQPGLVVHTCTTLLLPLAAAGRLPALADEVVKRLTKVPEDKAAAVREKVERYLACFVAALSG